MTKDILLELGPAVDQRAQYFSKAAAFQGALGNAALMGAGVFLAFAIVARMRKSPTQEALKACLAGFLGAGLVSFLIIYLWLPVVPVERLSFGSHGTRYWHMTLGKRLYVATIGVEELEVPVTNENLVELFERANRLRYGGTAGDDPYHQAPIDEASPGNYIILDDGGETVIRFFDFDGAPIDIRASDFGE